MQVGAQRVIGEVLLPQPRRKLGDPGGGVQRDALEHIDEGRYMDRRRAGGRSRASFG